LFSRTENRRKPRKRREKREDPGEGVVGQLAVMKAQVEFLKEGQREAGNFAVASHRGLRERGIVCMRVNDNQDASRVKTYGRYLHIFWKWLQKVDL
jgi:hypothetical protein